MPELPEVETVRRGLEPVLAGRMLAHVDQRRSNLRWPFPERFAQRLTGRRVTGLGRRSKYLLIGLDGGKRGSFIWGCRGGFWSKNPVTLLLCPANMIM
jgi:formamidopyrimidine-DNA glycosylase